MLVKLHERCRIASGQINGKKKQVTSIKKLPRVGAGTNDQSQIDAENGIKKRSSRLAHCNKIRAWPLYRLLQKFWP